MSISDELRAILNTMSKDELISLRAAVSSRLRIAVGRKGGRPKGAKDKVPRKRRAAAEEEAK